jgi:hypothetical protein
MDKSLASVKESDDDYKFVRDKYYELSEKGDDALELMMTVAAESEHPRAFEVLSNMIKQNAEIAEKLIDLQKKKRELEKGNSMPNSMTQNNVYVGSTTDIQRMLLEKMKEGSTYNDTTGKSPAPIQES